MEAGKGSLSPPAPFLSSAMLSIDHHVLFWDEWRVLAAFPSPHPRRPEKVGPPRGEVV